MADVTPERVLRSVRSIVSLSSGNGSYGSLKVGNTASKHVTGNEGMQGSSMDADRSLSLERDIHSLAYPEEKTVQTYAVTNVPRLDEPLDAGIRVNHSIQRTEEPV